MVKNGTFIFYGASGHYKKISTEALSHGTSYVPVTVSHTFTPGVENISNHQGNLLALNWLRHCVKNVLRMQGGLLAQTCIDRGRMGTWAVPQGNA